MRYALLHASTLRIAFAPLCDHSADLVGDECRLALGATPARASELSTGRVLARGLLRELGCTKATVGRGHDRAPLWPRGFVGSITHTRELCAVAVARESEFAAMGLDAEPDEPLERELWEEIATAREFELLASRGVRWSARTLFCAKEAAYKCLYPPTRRFLGFHDVEIAFDASGGRFGVRAPAAETFAAQVAGCVWRERGLVVALAGIEAPRRGGSP